VGVVELGVDVVKEDDSWRPFGWLNLNDDPPREVVCLCWTWRGMVLSANGVETSLGRGVVEGDLWVRGNVAETVRVCAKGVGRSIWALYSGKWV
jgi:hypothetical protein